MDHASFMVRRDCLVFPRWLRAGLFCWILLLPMIAGAQADIQAVSVIPESPTPEEELILRVSGDVFDTRFQLGSPVVNIINDQIAVIIDVTDLGIGLPVVLPYSIDVPIGILSAGTYNYEVTLRQILPPLPVPIVLDTESGVFSVMAPVPALSNVTRFAYGLVIALVAIATRRQLARRCS
jgi:hypothetical protein